MVAIEKFDCISLLNISFNFRMRGPHNFICRGTQKCHNLALGNISIVCKLSTFQSISHKPLANLVEMLLG
jgi:hypothetical protein